jgi:hypothetical protein
MGSFPFQLSGAATAAALAGQTIPGTLTTSGTLGTSSLANIVASGGVTAQFGNVDVQSAGSGLRVAEGSNAKQGTVVLAGAATTVVADTAVTANSRIFLTSQLDGGTPGFIRVSSRSVGTSFTISALVTDTSTVAYEIFEPG